MIWTSIRRLNRPTPKMYAQQTFSVSYGRVVESSATAAWERPGACRASSRDLASCPGLASCPVHRAGNPAHQGRREDIPLPRSGRRPAWTTGDEHAMVMVAIVVVTMPATAAPEKKMTATTNTIPATITTHAATW
ncbi:hypothetical protein I552_3366 [Mycobacterium xenopi 3993]|nr:hypothetical protein I552_3366 [Mycobacterium xenopi 3993]